jgi:hypothetical protein
MTTTPSGGGGRAESVALLDVSESAQPVRACRAGRGHGQDGLGMLAGVEEPAMGPRLPRTVTAPQTVIAAGARSLDLREIGPLARPVPERQPLMERSVLGGVVGEYRHDAITAARQAKNPPGIPLAPRVGYGISAPFAIKAQFPHHLFREVHTFSCAV